MPDRGLRRRRQGLAAVAGLLLLSSGALEQLVCAALARVVESWETARAADPDVRERMVDVLRTSNWRLDLATSERIADSVLRCSRDQRLAPDLVMAVMLVESTARPSARSPKGAIGLMQVMPHMFETLALPGSVSHIESNVEAGCMVLADNIRRLGEERGISSYFWGSRIRGTGYLDRVQAMRGRLLLAPVGALARDAAEASEG